MQIEQLQMEIETLSAEDFARLRRWFADKDWGIWDQQIEQDIAVGKLDFLIEEAMAAKRQGTLQEL